MKSSVAKKWRNLALTVDVSLGSRCNMDCLHCSAATLQSETRKELEFDDYVRLGNEFNKMRVIRVNITGGEPLLRPDFARVLAALGPGKRHVKLQTNGLLLTKNKIEEIKKVGVNAITISIDSLDPDEYSKFRGVSKASHATVLNALYLSRRAGLQISASFVLTHQNLRSESIKKLIEYTAENKITLLANIATASGKWQSRPDYLFDCGDRNYFNELIKKHRHIRTDHDLTGCPAAARKLYITPYGDVIPCPFIHVSFGNITEQSLLSIWKEMQAGFPFAGMPICPAGEDKAYLDTWYPHIAHSPILPIPYGNLINKVGNDK